VGGEPNSHDYAVSPESVAADAGSRPPQSGGSGTRETERVLGSGAQGVLMGRPRRQPGCQAKMRGQLVGFRVRTWTRQDYWTRHVLVDKARQVQAIEIMHVARAQEPVLRRHQAHHGNAPSPPQLPSITSCRKYATAAGSWHVEGILPRPLGGGSTPDEAPRRAGASAACAGFRRGAHRIAEVVRLTGPPRSRRLGPPARSRVASAPASA